MAVLIVSTPNATIIAPLRGGKAAMARELTQAEKLEKLREEWAVTWPTLADYLGCESVSTLDRWRAGKEMRGPARVLLDTFVECPHQRDWREGHMKRNPPKVRDGERRTEAVARSVKKRRKQAETPAPESEEKP
jgi:DNA-binding transcriptional regulator YiaG